MSLLAEVERVAKLCEKATPGPWRCEPKRLVLRGIEGPVMSYLAGDPAQPEGLKVSLGSERIADHELVAALRNLFHSRRAQIVEALREANQRRWQVANWHDLLGSMIAQVGHPDYSLHEMVDGMRKMRDQMFAEITSARKDAP